MKTSTEDVSTRHMTSTTRITTGAYFSTEDIGTTSVTQEVTSEPGVTATTTTLDTGVTYSSVNENETKPSTGVSSTSKAPAHGDTGFTERSSTDINIQSTESVADTKAVSFTSLILLCVVATLLTVL